MKSQWKGGTVAVDRAVARALASVRAKVVARAMVVARGWRLQWRQ